MGGNGYRFELSPLCAMGDREVEDPQRNATVRFRVCGQPASRCAPPWRPNAAHGEFITYWGQEPPNGTTCYSGGQTTPNCTRPCAVAGSHPPQTSALLDGVENIQGIRLVYPAPPPQAKEHACGCRPLHPSPPSPLTPPPPPPPRPRRSCGTDPVTGQARQRSVMLKLFCHPQAQGLVDLQFVNDSSDACRSTVQAKSRHACPKLTKCAHPGGREVQCAARGAPCTQDIATSFTDGVSVTMHVCEEGLRCNNATRSVCVPNPTEDEVARDFVRFYAQRCKPEETDPCGAAAHKSRLTDALSCRSQGQRGNDTVCSFVEGSRLMGQPCTFDDECGTRTCSEDGMCGSGSVPAGEPCGSAFDECVPSATCDVGTGRCRNNTYREGEDPPGAACGTGRVCTDGYACLDGRCFVAEGAACRNDEECGAPRFCKGVSDGGGHCAPRAGLGEACDAASQPCVRDDAYCGDDGTCSPLPGAGAPCHDGLCYQDTAFPSPRNAFCGRREGEEGECYLLGRIPNGRVVNALAPYACASGAGCQKKAEESDLQCVSPHPDTVPKGGGASPPCGFEPKCFFSGASGRTGPGQSHALVPTARFMQATGKDWASALDARNACLKPADNSNEAALRCLLSNFGAAGVCEALTPVQGTGYRPSDLRLLGVPACAVDTLIRTGLSHAQPNQAMLDADRTRCEAAVQSLCAFTFPSGFRYKCASGSPDGEGPPAWVIVLATVGGAGVLAVAAFALKRGFESRRHRSRRPGGGFSVLELQ